MPFRPVDHTVRRWEIWLAVLLVGIFAAVLVGITLDSRTQARKANDSVADLSTILARRAPTLEYLDCRDRAELPFQAAQAEYLLAAVDLGEISRDPAATPAALEQALLRRDEARMRYEAARLRLLAVNDRDAPLEADAEPGEPFRCPALPS